MARSGTDRVATEHPPASVPWETFLAALDHWKTSGIPGAGKLEKSLWETQSAAAQEQLASALRFLGLLDNQNQVLPSLPALVAAGPEDRKRLLNAIIKEKYARVLSHDLTSVTSGQMEAELRSFGVSGPTLMGAIRFFVRACQETGIAISKQLSEELHNLPTAQDSPAAVGSKDDAPNHAETLSPPITPRICRWEEKLLHPFPQLDRIRQSKCICSSGLGCDGLLP